MTEYLTARAAMELLELPSSTFHRFVREGKITKYYPTSVSKHGTYDPKEIARLRQRIKQEQKPVQTGQTDWIKIADLGHLYDLEYSIYGDQTGEPAIIRKWFDRNPYLCRILYNKDDRRDIWGAISMLPLPEETIQQLISGQMYDADLDPRDILTFEKPGVYNLYLTSTIIHPARRGHFIALLHSIFDFWCEQTPTRTIGKLYGRIATESGELMVKKLFFSPLLNLSDQAYMLDVSKHNPSRIVQRFQQCIKGTN